MVVLKSSHTPEELIRRWDDRLNPARFAGNDDVLDLVFCGKRKGNKIMLMRRTGVSREPLSSIFRGKIVGTAEGSEIRGFFTKSVAEYIIIGIIVALAMAVFLEVKKRYAEISRMSVAFLVVFVLAVVSLLRTGKGTKEKYIDFLKGIL